MNVAVLILHLELRKQSANYCPRSVFEKCYLSVSKISTSLPKAAVYAQHAEHA